VTYAKFISTVKAGHSDHSQRGPKNVTTRLWRLSPAALLSVSTSGIVVSPKRDTSECAEGNVPQTCLSVHDFLYIRYMTSLHKKHCTKLLIKWNEIYAGHLSLHK